MDARDEERLFEQYRPLVKHVARRLWHADSRVRGLGTFEDACQVGYLALLRAGRHYDPSVSKFITYGYHCIRQGILRAALEDGGLIHVPEHAYHRADTPRRQAYRAAAHKARRFVRLENPGWLRQRPQSAEELPLDPADVPALLRVLPARYAQIVRWRFGIDGDGPLLLGEIGARLGVTRERARQLVAKSMARLRKEAQALTEGVAP